jgi:hypothetical protein
MCDLDLYHLVEHSHKWSNPLAGHFHHRNVHAVDSEGICIRLLLDDFFVATISVGEIATLLIAAVTNRMPKTKAKLLFFSPLFELTMLSQILISVKGYEFFNKVRS